MCKKCILNLNEIDSFWINKIVIFSLPKTLFFITFWARFYWYQKYVLHRFLTFPKSNNKFKLIRFVSHIKNLVFSIFTSPFPIFYFLHPILPFNEFHWDFLPLDFMDKIYARCLCGIMDFLHVSLYIKCFELMVVLRSSKDVKKQVIFLVKYT